MEKYHKQADIISLQVAGCPDGSGAGAGLCQ